MTREEQVARLGYLGVGLIVGGLAGFLGGLTLGILRMH